MFVAVCDVGRYRLMLLMRLARRLLVCLFVFLCLGSVDSEESRRRIVTGVLFDFSFTGVCRLQYDS
jgi:hypothetical protein